MKFKRSSCECRSCRRACETRPCWPNPEQGKALALAFPEKVVVDTSLHVNGQAVRVTRPAAVNETAGGEYRAAMGACVFYNKGRCDLHYSELKPMEGRLASHEHSNAQAVELRRVVGLMWL